MLKYFYHFLWKIVRSQLIFQNLELVTFAKCFGASVLVFCGHCHTGKTDNFAMSIVLAVVYEVLRFMIL